MCWLRVWAYAAFLVVFLSWSAQIIGAEDPIMDPVEGDIFRF